MPVKSPSFQSARKTKALPFALLLALGLVGCAQFPELDSLAQPKPAADYQTASSFSAAVGAWPEERWWQAYGDPQLDTLIDEALRDSPDMAAAAARFRQAEAFSQVTGSLLFPLVSASAAATEMKQSYNYMMPRAALPQGWNDYGQATLNLNWELDFWGKNRAGIAAATSQLAASRAELAHVRLSLAAAVAVNYAELSRLFATRDTLARSVDVRSKTLSLFDKRFANGLETKGGVSEAKARLAGAEGELLMIDEQIGLQRNRLASLLGAGPDRGLAIQRPSVKLDSHYELPATLAADLLGRRPDVVAARLQSEAQLRRIDQKKAEFYPNINLSAFIGVQALGLNLLNNSGSDFGAVGPAISLPIFTAGRLHGELRGTVAAYDQAVAIYNLVVTQALREVADAGLSQKALAAQLKKAEAAVEAAGDAHRVANDRYEGGLATYLEVLYAEDGLLSCQRNLTSLQSKAFALDVALKRALGGGYQSKDL